jgi:spore maturation protein CgeB
VRSRSKAADLQSKGRQKGYHTGHQYGYFLGRCEAVLSQLPVLPQQWRDIRVLYVTTGKLYPYAPLDFYIVMSMKPLIREVVAVSPKEDVLRIAEQYKPDLVLVLEGTDFPAAGVNGLRSKGIRAAVWLTDDPYYTERALKSALHYDYVFTLEKNCVPFYESHGCKNVHYLPLAAYTPLFRPQSVSLSNRKDIGFLGSAYWNRVRLIEPLTPFLSSQLFSIKGNWWERLRNASQLSAQISDEWLSPEQTVQFYNETKIVINMHRASNDESFDHNSVTIHAASPNPRTFEISSCASLQLTDVREDLASFYIPGEELVTYSSAEEMREKIKYYLENKEERIDIALRGLQRTHRDHTYIQRLSRLLSIVFD